MGVAGSGKTTIAKLLAERLGAEYIDGDWLHPASNVEKMRGGTPLTDEDRWPWLRAIAARVDELNAQGARRGGRMLRAEARLPRCPDGRPKRRATGLPER
jgi:carbohydrate kinase (thermoresistant glucokinase family)